MMLTSQWSSDSEDDNLEEIIGYPSDEDERTEDETEWETLRTP